MATGRDKLPETIMVTRQDEGHYVASYRYKLFRFLLDDGRVIDVEGIEDGSRLRGELLATLEREAKAAGEPAQFAIVGVATLGFTEWEAWSPRRETK